MKECFECGKPAEESQIERAHKVLGDMLATYNAASDRGEDCKKMAREMLDFAIECRKNYGDQ